MDTVKVETCRECGTKHSGELCPSCGSLEVESDLPRPVRFPPSAPRHSAGCACVPCVARRSGIRSLAVTTCPHLDVYEPGCLACDAGIEILEGRA